MHCGCNTDYRSLGIIHHVYISRISIFTILTLTPPLFVPSHQYTYRIISNTNINLLPLPSNLSIPLPPSLPLYLPYSSHVLVIQDWNVTYALPHRRSHSYRVPCYFMAFPPYHSQRINTPTNDDEVQWVVDYIKRE